MSRTLVIAQHDGQQLNPATSRSVQCALDLGNPIDVAVFASNVQAIANQAAKLHGVEKVIGIARAENAKPLAAILAPQIVALVNDYSHVLVGSTTFGKDVMARVAGLLDAPQVSDVMEVIDARTFKRPIYAGNVITTVKVADNLKVIATVRTASYKTVAEDGTAEIVNHELDVSLPTYTRYVELKSEQSDRPDLQSANRVISGGRGVGSKENFEIVYRLAEKMGAAVGASRAAVDAGYVPNDMQVGQTGKIIAPELYMAFGISGAIQHITGIKDAGTIVAINKDPDAPIFEIADLGLVGDLFEIIPELEKAID